MKRSPKKKKKIQEKSFFLVFASFFSHFDSTSSLTSWTPPSSHANSREESHLQE